MIPKFRKGQILINKKSKEEIIIKKIKTRRFITKNYSGFIDEFTGFYEFISISNNEKQRTGEISEEVLLNDFQAN